MHIVGLVLFLGSQVIEDLIKYKIQSFAKIISAVSKLLADIKYFFSAYFR